MILIPNKRHTNELFLHLQVQFPAKISIQKIQNWKDVISVIGGINHCDAMLRMSMYCIVARTIESNIVLNELRPVFFAICDWRDDRGGGRILKSCTVMNKWVDQKNVCQLFWPSLPTPREKALFSLHLYICLWTSYLEKLRTQTFSGELGDGLTNKQFRPMLFPCFLKTYTSSVPSAACRA